MSSVSRQHGRQIFTIGSSYCVDGTAGSERMGGCRVRLKCRTGDTGQLRIERTFVFTTSPPDLDQQMELFFNESARGVRDWAKAHNVDLEAFDIVIDEFIYHDVNANPDAFYKAGVAAIAAAMTAMFPKAGFL